jgi:hypothetical protein
MVGETSRSIPYLGVMIYFVNMTLNYFCLAQPILRVWTAQSLEHFYERFPQYEKRLDFYADSLCLFGYFGGMLG